MQIVRFAHTHASAEVPKQKCSVDRLLVTHFTHFIHFFTNTPTDTHTRALFFSGRIFTLYHQNGGQRSRQKRRKKRLFICLCCVWKRKICVFFVLIPSGWRFNTFQPSHPVYVCMCVCVCVAIFSIHFSLSCFFAYPLNHARSSPHSTVTHSVTHTSFTLHYHSRVWSHSLSLTHIHTLTRDTISPHIAPLTWPASGTSSGILCRMQQLLYAVSFHFTPRCTPSSCRNVVGFSCGPRGKTSNEVPRRRNWTRERQRKNAGQKDKKKRWCKKVWGGNIIKGRGKSAPLFTVCVCFLFYLGWEGEAFYTNQRFETRSASITVVGGKYRKRFGTKRQLKRVEPQLCGLIFFVFILLPKWWPFSPSEEICNVLAPPPPLFFSTSTCVFVRSACREAQWRWNEN